MITTTTRGAAAPELVTEAMVEAAYEASRRHRPEMDRVDIIEILEAALAAEAARVPEERDLLSSADADLSRPGAPPTGQRWRHVERGTVYDEVCRAELQVSTALPVEGRTIVVYCGEDGRLWARDQYEFEDGRFERVSGPQIFLGPAVDPEHLTIADYEQVLADKRRLTRELDVAMHGEAGAAKQASLCDLVEPARRLRTAARLAEADRDLAIVEAERFSSALEALRDALIWMRDRDDRNGSLPDPYRAKIDAALAAAPKAGTDGATSP